MRLWFWRPPCLLRSCILNLKSDATSAIKGVLWSSRGQWLTFRKCQLLIANQPPKDMDGEVVVHRSNIAFLQVIE